MAAEEVLTEGGFRGWEGHMGEEEGEEGRGCKGESKGWTGEVAMNGNGRRLFSRGGGEMKGGAHERGRQGEQSRGGV